MAVPSASLTGGGRGLRDLPVNGGFAAFKDPLFRKTLNPGHHRHRQPWVTTEVTVRWIVTQAQSVDAQICPCLFVLLGPQSGPPCFRDPPTIAGAISAALSLHRPAHVQPRAAIIG